MLFATKLGIKLRNTAKGLSDCMSNLGAEFLAALGCTISCIKGIGMDSITCV